MRECDEKGRAVISSLGCQMMCQPSLVEQMKGPVPRLFIPLVLGLTMVCTVRVPRGDVPISLSLS